MSLERDSAGTGAAAGGELCWVALERMEAGQLLLLEPATVSAPPGKPLLGAVATRLAEGSGRRRRGCARRFIALLLVL